MRIIAGAFKGRRLMSPDGPGLRPTSDRLRETWFNILGDTVVGARVLDGFAGTGALGLEALSRGAARSTFIECDRRAMPVLRQNIRRCGAANACTIVERDFFRAGLGPSSFDLVLLDPPYDLGELERAIRLGGASVAAGGRLVLEHSRRRAPPDGAAPLRRARTVIAGDSALSFYQ